MVVLRRTSVAPGEVSSPRCRQRERRNGLARGIGQGPKTKYVIEVDVQDYGRLPCKDPFSSSTN